ncbi:MAG: FAD:protein FMN transferase [Proteobacteria bacterium]|nr:FAD:protein FMN transferase [Pseudomonadota bacterium]
MSKSFLSPCFLGRYSGYVYPLIALSVVLVGCSLSRDNGQKSTSKAAESQIRTIHRSDGAMGTLFEITVVIGKKAPFPTKAFAEAFAEVHRIEDLMSVWKSDSPLAKVNTAAGKMPVPVPREIIDIVLEANNISELTNGKFDISFAAIEGLWDFHSKNPNLPKHQDILDRLPLINYRSILVNEKKNTIMLNNEKMKISLGAIAKGYAVDRAALILRKHGLNDFIIFGGGDLVVRGKKGNRHWRVGIQDPRTRSRYFARFEPKDHCAIVTSGDYEKFFVLDNSRYHHILDTDTGYPVEGVVSVTVIAKKATWADGVATGIFALGPENGMALIESDPDLEGLIVDTDLNVHVSSGLKQQITLTPIVDPARNPQ